MCGTVCVLFALDAFYLFLLPSCFDIDEDFDPGHLGRLFTAHVSKVAGPEPQKSLLCQVDLCWPWKDVDVVPAQELVCKCSLATESHLEGER